MKRRITPFQAIILVVFGVGAVGGMLFFAGFGGLGQQDTSFGNVLIWGTLNEGAFQAVIGQLAEDDDRMRSVAYVQKDPRTYNSELAEALASGVGPDLFLLEHDFIVRHQDKIAAIPYENLPRQQFESTFVEGAEIFLTQEGTLGVPVAVDPLVLYWNEDLLSSAGFVGAPQYWDELFEMSEKLTQRDDANNVEKSTVAFGEFENVFHAKEIVSTLILQAGGEITVRDDQGVVRPVLATRAASDATQPAQSALRFYTEFANPSKTVYSWNRSLPDSRQAFIAGDLALYIGYASELALLQQLNPNLNFAVSSMPQIRGVDRALTFGKIYAFSIPLAARNVSGALSTAFILSGQEPSALLSEARGTPSPRRDVLATQTDGPEAVFRNMAIITRGWIDPSPFETTRIFRDMIEGVTSGESRLSDAVSTADRAIGNLLNL